MYQHKQNKTEPQHLNNIDTRTHTTVTQLTTPMDTNNTPRIWILITPGVLKRNCCDMIGSPGTHWFWLVDRFINLLKYWLRWVVYHNLKSCGTLVVNIKWYCYLQTTRGDRVYRLQPGSAKGVVYCVKSIIKNLDGIRFKCFENSRYILSRDSVKRITNYITWLTKE